MRLTKTQAQELRRGQKELRESVKKTALRLRQWQRLSLDDRNTWVILSSLAQNLMTGAAAGAQVRKLLTEGDESQKRPGARRAA
jgi:hypothetical protein